MRSRHIEIILVSGLALALLGCQTAQREKVTASQVSVKDVPLGKLELSYPNFRTLEDLKAQTAPRDESEKFYLFEKNGTKVAVVMRTWGSGLPWNAVILYAYSPFSRQWVARAVWDTDTTNVRATFNKWSGNIHIRSGKGVPIFTANIDAFNPNRRMRDW